MLAQASGRGWRRERERERVRASVTKDTVARTWLDGGTAFGRWPLLAWSTASRWWFVHGHRHRWNGRTGHTRLLLDTPR